MADKLPPHDKDRDKRIMDLAQKIKAANPSQSMKLCLLDAIIADNKKRKVPDIFK